MSLNTEHKVTLTTDQLWQLIELINSNNQYNEDEEEIESWKQIAGIFETVVDKYYRQIAEARSQQPTAEWED